MAPGTFGATVWFTGLSGSGKSTLARELFGLLNNRHADPYLLDGDDLRRGLNVDLGYSFADREENVRRIGEVALLVALAGHICLVSAISPYAAGRRAVRALHEVSGIPFVEVYVSTPLATCEARDTKGLYARARSGELADFTGISDPYEAPLHPEIEVDTEACSPQTCANDVLTQLASHSSGLLVAPHGQ